MKLSIIIPVYRVEHVLDRCIESVRQQSFVDWEMILVDDGSPDKCPQMCDEWAKNDKRIKVIHQLNGGLSEARNTGLAHAQGEFIAFIDSDDTLAPDTLSEALRALKRHTEYNIVEFPVVVGYGSSRQQYLSLGNHGYTDVHAYWIEQQGYLHAYAWNKVYRRCLFHKIRFPRSKVFEDIITTARLWQYSDHQQRPLLLLEEQRGYHCICPLRGFAATVRMAFAYPPKIHLSAESFTRGTHALLSAFS